MKVEQTNCPVCNGLLREASLYDDLDGKLTWMVCSRRTARWIEVTKEENLNADDKTTN